MSRRWTARLALAAGAPLVFLLLLEGVLALAGVGVPRYDGLGDGGRYWVPHEQPGEAPGSARAFPRHHKHVPEALPLFLRDKPANGWRVFTLGESSVKGAPYEVGSFTDWLRLRAAAMLPDRAVEVVNAGNVGWHATDIRLLLQECLEHEPDLLVWMVGHNEFVPHNVLGLREEVLRPVRTALRRAVARLRTHHWLAGFLPGLRGERQPVFDQLQSSERPCYGPELPLLRQRFRETTAGAVADARAAGVPIVLCTMPRNLRASSPNYSFFSEATRNDPALRARWDEAYRAGTSALEAGEPAAAVAALQRALALDAAPAKLHFALGRAHEALGHAEAARAAFEQALEQDACPMRAQAWAEEAIRDVARETGAPLLDLQALFDRAGALGLAGDELIFDNVHPNLSGHEHIASALIGLVERELGVAFDRGRDVPPPEGRERLGLSGYGARAGRQAEALDLAKLALLAGTANESWRAARDACNDVLAADPTAWEVSGALGLLEAIAGRPHRAKALIEQAMERNGYVKLSYVFFWRTEVPYQRAFAAAGVDMAAVEAALAPVERANVENRLHRAQTR